jgi:hypothetical protein
MAMTNLAILIIRYQRMNAQSTILHKYGMKGPIRGIEPAPERRKNIN